MPTIQITDEAHWLSVRDSFIGGSEVSALFARWLLPSGEKVTLHAYEEPPEGAIPLGSCSPYTDAHSLWLHKSGKVPPKEWEENERMQAGSFLEPAIAAWAKEKWGWKLRKVRRYNAHDTIKGWGASVDFEEHGPGMEPVEIKNIDFLIARDNWIIEDGEVVVPPIHIILQLQHYIGARNAAAGWIMACVGGNTLVRGKFERHEPTIARIGEAITAFWQGVALDIPPNSTPFEAVKEEFRYGRAVKDALDLRGDSEAAMMARRYMRWKKHLEFTETHLSHIKGGLARKIGEVTKVMGDGWKATWPVIEREEKLIPAKVQKAMSYRGGFTVTEVK